MKSSDFEIDQDVVPLLKKGSIIAFEKLFNRYSEKLYRFTFSYLKSESEAEDVVQEVFLKIWENRAKLKTGTSFQSYLFTIAFNSIRKNFNAKARQNKFRIDLLEFLSHDKPSLESQPDFETLLTKLDSLIDQMPERRKEIFMMRKKEGKAVRDIAEKLNISTKTVENQITEAMNQLKKEFAKDQISGILFFYMFLD